MSTRVQASPLLRSNPWRRLPTALGLGLLAFVGVLTLLFDMAGLRVAPDITSRLSAAETVVVWSVGLESADAAQARAAEILAGVPAVRSVTPLDPATGDQLIARTMGAPGTSEARLLTVDVADGDLTSRLQQTLRARGMPGVVIGRGWKESAAARSALLVVAVGGLAPLIAIIGFVVICGVEARREMARGRAVVELVSTSGASDGYIAGLVQARVAGLALSAALWGAAAAIIAATVISRKGLADALGGLSREDLASPWPLIVVIVWLLGALAAWLSARARLRRRA
jgi:cell division protein FtsX